MPAAPSRLPARSARCLLGASGTALLAAAVVAPGAVADIPTAEGPPWRDDLRAVMCTTPCPASYDSIATVEPGVDHHVRFENLPAPGDTPYEVEIRRRGETLIGPTPVEPTDADDDGLGLVAYEGLRVDALQAGAEFHYLLTRGGEAVADVDYSIAWGMPRLSEDTLRPVFAGDPVVFGFTGVVADPDLEFYLIRHVLDDRIPVDTEVLGRVDVPEDPDEFAAADTLDTTRPRDVAYQLYALPTPAVGGPGPLPVGDGAEQARWLAEHGARQFERNSVQPVFEPRTRATSGYSDPQHDFGHGATVTFTVDRLELVDDYAGPDAYALILDVRTATRELVDLDVVTADDPRWRTDPAGPGQAFTVTYEPAPDTSVDARLYRLPPEPLDSFADDAHLARAMRRGGRDTAATSLGFPVTTGAGDGRLPSDRRLRGQDQDGRALPPVFGWVPADALRTGIFMGDWDGDGIDTPGYRLPGTNSFHLAGRLTAGPGASDWTRVDYGRPDTTVYVGDWDGDGRDTFAVRRAGTNVFQFRNDLAGGAAEFETRYGRAGDDVLVGTFRAGGSDALSVRRGNSFFLKYDISGGEADVQTDYGRTGDDFLIGDWDGDGVDTPTIRRGSEYHVQNGFTGGVADEVIEFGRADDVALVGRIDRGGPDVLLTVRVTTDGSN